MEIKEFEQKIQEQLNKIDIKLTKVQIEKFYKYMNILLEWNEKINLTAITDENEIIQKHFVDSLTIYKHIQKGNNIADIGTGAGFPGIPLKILFEDDIKIILIDSLNKRIKFLDEVIKKLNLTKIETVHGRAEEIGKNKKYRENFDIVTSRAVANLSVLLEYMLPLVKKGGECICMKGSDIEEEFNNSKNAIKLLGGEFKDIEKFYLPNSDIKRNVIFISKINNTPAKFPRKPGTPAKDPIK